MATLSHNAPLECLVPEDTLSTPSVLWHAADTRETHGEVRKRMGWALKKDWAPLRLVVNEVPGLVVRARHPVPPGDEREEHVRRLDAHGAPHQLDGTCAADSGT